MSKKKTDDPEVLEEEAIETGAASAKMVRAVCRRGFRVGDGSAVAPGEVIELSYRDFKVLEHPGKVRAFDPKIDGAKK